MVKHIWQSSQKHTPGPFDVTEDVAGLTPPAYLRAIFKLPMSDSAKKRVSLCWGPDPGNLEKDLPELSGVGSFRGCAAPGQALPLYVDQTPLQHYTRPELSEGSHHSAIAIHCKAAGVQSRLFQTFKELDELRFGILRHIILSRYKHMGTSIHQGDKTARAAQESAVKDEVLTLTQTQHRRWCWLFQLAAYHVVKLPCTVSTLAHQLSYRVTFDNPQFEQILLSNTLVLLTTPPIRSSARLTKPPLFPFSVMPVFSEFLATSRTEFFCS
jgi:hypothetical protein